jgi:hypothetical protein
MKVSAVVSFVVAALVVACGGGSSGGSPSPKSPDGSSAASPGAESSASTTLSASPPEGMGVGAKRRMKTLQEKIIPDYTAELKSACGFEIPIEVDWASFSKLQGKTCKDGGQETPCDESALFGLGNQYSLGYVVGGVTGHCTDKIGKDAVKQKVKRIRIKAVEKTADKSMELKDGVFMVQGAWQEVNYPSAGPYFDFLEKRL